MTLSKMALETPNLSGTMLSMSAALVEMDFDSPLGSSVVNEMSNVLNSAFFFGPVGRESCMFRLAMYEAPSAVLNFSRTYPLTDCIAVSFGS